MGGRNGGAGKVIRGGDLGRGGADGQHHRQGQGCRIGHAPGSGAAARYLSAVARSRVAVADHSVGNYHPVWCLESFWTTRRRTRRLRRWQGGGGGSALRGPPALSLAVRAARRGTGGR